MDDNLDFSPWIMYWKKIFGLLKSINAQYQIRTHRPDFFLKKNKRTCLFIWYSRVKAPTQKWWQNDKKWATGQSCIHKEVTPYKIHNLVIRYLHCAPSVFLHIDISSFWRGKYGFASIWVHDHSIHMDEQVFNDSLGD